MPYTEQTMQLHLDLPGVGIISGAQMGEKCIFTGSVVYCGIVRKGAVEKYFDFEYSV